jgi:hypothetical protein
MNLKKECHRPSDMSVLVAPFEMNNWRLFRWVLFLLISLGWTTLGWAGPPFETDDPEPPELGHWEIFLGATALQVQNDLSGTAPFLAVNWGGLPDTQFSLTEQAAFNSPAGLNSAYGYGDTQLSVKYRFLHETEGTPQAAVFPQVDLPTGDSKKGLGAGQVQFLLPLWLQKSWGPWTSFGGGGYWIDPGPGNKNWVFLGWAIQRDLSSRFTLGGELFYHSASSDGLSDNVGFNVGGIINFDPVDHLVFSAGRDLLQGGNQFTGFLAYRWTFPGEE